MRRFLIAALILALAATGVFFWKSNHNTGPPPLRLAYQNRIGSALAIVAVEKQFFQEEGLSIEASRFNSGPACSEALYSGSVEIGTMGDTAAVIAVSRNPGFVIIASHGAGEHRHRIVVAKDSPLQKPENLVGRRLAVKKGTSTYGGLLAFCDARGIDAGKINLIDMRPGEMTEALLAGSLDAFVASEPTPSLAQARGARELATLGGLGNHYPLLIVARRDFLRNRPDKAAAFMRAMRRAEKFVRRHPGRATALLSRVSGLPSDSTRRAMQRHTYRLRLGADIRRSLAKTADFLHSAGTIDARPDWETSLDNRVVAASPDQPQR